MRNDADIQKIKDLEGKTFNVKQRNMLMAGGIVGLFILCIMFSAQIISGIGALIVLVIGLPLAFWLGNLIRKADPLIQQKTNNFLLKKATEEAAKNSIQQLDNDLLSKKEKVQTARTKRDEVLGQIKTLEKNIGDMSSSSEFRPKMEKTLETFKTAYAIFAKGIKEADKATKVFEGKVAEYKIYVKFTESAEAIAKAMNSEDSLGDLLSTVAFDAIDQQFNTALSAIENMELDNGED